MSKQADADIKADFKIDRDGKWHHNGAPIKREALAKLFSGRALKVDADGKYWLQTPFEKYPVDVADVPYLIIDYTADLHLKTNMDETVKLTRDTNWQLRGGIPYLEVRDGLFARIARPVLYNMINSYGASIKIDGKNFPLG